MEIEDKIFEKAIYITAQTINVYIIFELINKKEPSSLQILLIIIDAAIAIPLAIALSANFDKQFLEKNLEAYLAIIFLICYFIIRSLLLPNIDPLELLAEEALLFTIEFFIITFFNKFTKTLNNKAISHAILIFAEILALQVFDTFIDSINGKDNNFIENCLYYNISCQ